MSLTELEGRDVAFDVSDPWDFGAEHGTGPFAGLIEAVSQQGVLLRLVRHYELIGRGVAIHWPDIDEDVSVPRLFGLPC